MLWSLFLVPLILGKVWKSVRRSRDLDLFWILLLSKSTFMDCLSLILVSLSIWKMNKQDKMAPFPAPPKCLVLLCIFYNLMFGIWIYKASAVTHPQPNFPNMPLNTSPPRPALWLLWLLESHQINWEPGENGWTFPGLYLRVWALFLSIRCS